MTHSQPPKTDDPYDPVFLHARREAVVILCVWLACLVWSLGWYAGHGLSASPDDVATWLGMPRWVVLSIFLPWMVANLLATWFCFGFMVDDDLGEASDEVGSATDAAAPATRPPGPPPTGQEPPDA